MMRFGLLLTFAVTSVGCSTRPMLKLDWVPAAALAHDTKQYPDAAAVVLHRSDHMLLALRQSESSFTQRGEHLAIYLQKEGAFDLAEVKIPHMAKDTLVNLKARIISPDGSIRELDAAQMLTDANGKGERDVNARFFRFPAVKVGSILEYWYVIENEHLYFWSDQDTVGRYPVKRYNFEITASKPVRLELKEYNAAYPINKETLADGSQRFWCDIDNIPGQERESFSPHWTFTQPRWAFRITKFVFPGVSSAANNDWKAVIDGRAINQMVKGELFEGFTEKLDVSGCSDVLCKVQRALKKVRESTRFKEGSSSARPLKEVLEVHEATALERTILAARLLNDAGVDTRIAALTEVWSQQIDPLFPLTSRFNYQLLQVRPQGELKEPLWVDASRDDLAPGQLSSQHIGTQALTYRAYDRGPIDPLVEAEWATTAAQTAPPMTWRHTHQAKLEPNTDLLNTVIDEAIGVPGRTRESEERELTDGEFQDKARGWVLSASPFTRLESPARRDCAFDKGVCSRTFVTKTPGYAFFENGRYSVPLKFMAATWTELFSDDERTDDIYLVGDSRNEEVVNLEAPKGYGLAGKPLRLQQKAGGFEAEVSIEPTPRGAKVTRTLTRLAGPWPKAGYAEMQKAVRLFQDARRQVLTFEKTTTAAAPR